MIKPYIIIDNTKIKINNSTCIINNKSTKVNNISVNISVYLDSLCNAKCKFCCATKDYIADFNFNKFENILREIKNNSYTINRIIFTGGEPLLNKNLFNAMYIAKQYTNELVLNTNGFIYPNNKCIDLVDVINMSIHHYDNNINNDIFGLNKDINIFNKWLDYKNKIIPTCVLMKSYINKEDDIINYLDYIDSKGFKKAAFYGLMRINDYTKDEYIDINNIKFNNKYIINNKRICYPIKNICQCNNYCYTSKINNIIPFYIRQVINHNYDKGNFILFKNNQIISKFK